MNHEYPYICNVRPQDIAILLKIVCYNKQRWYNAQLAGDLLLSPGEISYSLQRSAYSGLIDGEKKKVRTQALLEFLIYGMPYVFPQHPASISRGMPTAHSHPFMQAQFSSEQLYVWPDADSDERGQSVEPLYPGAVKAAKKDEQLYLMLALADVLRVGKTREKQTAIKKYKELFGL